MFKIQTFILWHYQFGSKFDTPFWKYAKTLPFIPDDEFNNIVQYVKSVDNTLSKKDYEYALWSIPSFKNWADNT